MIGVWTYPWTLYGEGLDAACEELVDRGVEELVVSTHHHSARVLQPRLPDALFDGRPGGCYFDPSPERFADAAIEPIPNEVEGVEDPLAEVAAAAGEHGLRTSGWTVCLHNTRLGAAYPDYRLEDAFGNAHDHAFCPSHPEVRAYFAAVAAAVAARGVDAVELEKVRFPSVFHGHGRTFGHDERLVLATEAGERLFSQCFCDGCRREAREHAVDVERARAVVREVVERSFEDPRAEPRSLADLAREYPVLADLVRFRGAVVESLLERVADAVDGADVTTYVRRGDPDRAAGATLDGIERHADRIRVLCYVADPAEARDRIRTVREGTDLPVDAGVTLDPSVIDGPGDLHAVVDAIRAETDGRVAVYNHAMMTEAHLDWVGELAD